MSEAKFYEHKFKCTQCGLHFIVCSDFEQWPNLGTTRDQNLGESTGLIYCPECGSNGPKVHWRKETDGFIFQSVPGDAVLLEVT
jgi:hypothetical protein